MQRDDIGERDEGQTGARGQVNREERGGGGRRDALDRKGPQRAAPEAVREAVGGGCRSGWGRLLSVTNASEAGTWRQGDSGWA